MCCFQPFVSCAKVQVHHFDAIHCCAIDSISQSMLIRRLDCGLLRQEGLLLITHGKRIAAARKLRFSSGHLCEDQIASTCTTALFASARGFILFEPVRQWQPRRRVVERRTCDPDRGAEASAPRPAPPRRPSPPPHRAGRRRSPVSLVRRSGACGLCGRRGVLVCALLLVVVAADDQPGEPLTSAPFLPRLPLRRPLWLGAHPPPAPLS